MVKTAAVSLLALAGLASAFVPTTTNFRSANRWTIKAKDTSFTRNLMMKLGADDKVILIGVAADSGCGKSTFMRRLTNIFGGSNVGPLGGGFDNGGWETNTLVSDTTTVICLDDYHANDRSGRKVTGRTALEAAEQNFDLMYEQLKALKEGKTVAKPIYNHVNGTLDRPEEVVPTPIVIVEGLHPWYDARVKDLLDYTIYLDISDEIKRAWKIQRDMAERGWTLEQVEAEIEKRKPDFNKFVGPQKEVADSVIQVLPTELTNDPEGKILRVRLIQKETGDYQPVYLFDQGSTVSWIPCGTKLTCSYPGIKLGSGPDRWFDNAVNVVEMDGQFDKLEELAYVEKHLGNTASKYDGEITAQMLKNKGAPGTLNGSGLFQTIVSLKIREVYEKLSGKKVDASVKAPVAA
ncbi:hypothetical protein NSK_003771 [Nannochloropsis salina CCMP1776]|jgi:phosphoribulokinase|uniref:Phosphoribulokinase n=1 Tax=Nannochloropsis salina CCMP1776 TaxID=1027361 RepID=A0A4D9D820_9STRA|nr:hypothetical protein NSK_003771 [Nannochloropsis salina CCMP1776]|eukprot:TFJ84739.1 hypothetical protein NSK_003771 [Nannochloropsis salina CCMP1776]